MYYVRGTSIEAFSCGVFLTPGNASSPQGPYSRCSTLLTTYLCSAIGESGVSRNTLREQRTRAALSRWFFEDRIAPVTKTDIESSSQSQINGGASHSSRESLSPLTTGVQGSSYPRTLLSLHSAERPCDDKFRRCQKDIVAESRLRGMVRGRVGVVGGSSSDEQEDAWDFVKNPGKVLRDADRTN
jgi:hypothetical protein